jgi:hypothetical protein
MFSLWVTWIDTEFTIWKHFYEIYSNYLSYCSFAEYQKLNKMSFGLIQTIAVFILVFIEVLSLLPSVGKWIRPLLLPSDSRQHQLVL